MSRARKINYLDKPYTRTDLDRYLIKQFEQFITCDVGSRINAMGFIQPSSNKYVRTITAYPHLFKDSPSIIGHFEEPLEYFSQPLFAQFTAIKSIDDKLAQILRVRGNKWHYDYAKPYIIEVKSWEEKPLEDLKDTIFRKETKHWKTRKHLGDEVVTSLSYQYFRSKLMMDVEGYNGEKLYREVATELLDGTELEGKEDLLPLVAIASKPFAMERQRSRAGGFHVAMLGKKGLSTVEMRIIGVTSDPVLEKLKYWNSFKTVPNIYKEKYSSRDTNFAKEYAVLLRKKSKRRKDIEAMTDDMLHLPFDYPLQIINAPLLEEEMYRGTAGDPDLANYIAYMRFTYPPVPEGVYQESVKIIQGLNDFYSKLDITRMYLGRGMFFDLNYDGKPETVLRMALAIARIHDSPVTIKYVKLAEDMLYNVLDSVSYQFIKDPETTLTREALEKYIYETAIELIESYPIKGIPKEVLLKQWNNKFDVEDALTKLLDRGRMLEPSPGYYIPME
ncbi:MAG: hypothetical protein ACXAEU_26295 [Candidatus Hodarchaeales archaeon]